MGQVDTTAQMYFNCHNVYVKGEKDSRMCPKAVFNFFPYLTFMYKRDQQHTFTDVHFLKSTESVGKHQ